MAGGGFAAIRDFASYAKHDPEAITPAERVFTGKASRRMGASCAISSIKASMRMKKEGWRWTECWPTLLEPAGQLQLPLRPAFA